MKNIPAILLLTFAILLTGCKKSIFITDASNNLLPAYSETGNNIAGAMLNDTAWQSRIHPCFACNAWPFYINSSLSGDSTVFRLRGYYTSNSIQYIDTSYYNIPVDFYFVIKGLKLETQDSLMKLNNRTFQLNTINGYAAIVKSDRGIINNKGSGTLTIDKVQKGNWESGDGSAGNPKIYRFVVSGHFSFQSTADRLYTIKDGRFDMEVYFNTNFSVAN